MCDCIFFFGCLGIAGWFFSSQYNNINQIAYDQNIKITCPDCNKNSLYFDTESKLVKCARSLCEYKRIMDHTEQFILINSSSFYKPYDRFNFIKGQNIDSKSDNLSKHIELD